MSRVHKTVALSQHQGPIKPLQTTVVPGPCPTKMTDGKMVGNLSLPPLMQTGANKIRTFFSRIYY